RHPAVELHLVVLGPHLSPEFGLTADEIERDGLCIHTRLECLLSSDTDVGMAKTIGLATLGLADTLARLRPDLLLLIADRYEMLAPASVALALRIPIAHIEGGEISEGAIDDAVRNALTKMAHIHFTSTLEARCRVIAMGEEAWRVHHAGAPSLDHLRRRKLLQCAELERRLQVDLSLPSILVCQHPVTLDRDTTQEANAVFAALERLPDQLLFCYPNADAGGRSLIERSRQFLSSRGQGKIWTNLDPITYWSLLKHVPLLVGNSSSGIMESASFAVPTVNIGARQQGRIRPQNVLDAAAESESILRAIARAKSDSFKESLRDMKNPYGDGNACEIITQVLTSVPLGRDLLIKRAVPCALGSSTD